MSQHVGRRDLEQLLVPCLGHHTSAVAYQSFSTYTNLGVLQNLANQAFRNMEVMSLDTTPAFTRLPAELLMLILDQQHSKSDKYAGDMYATFIAYDRSSLSNLPLKCRLCDPQITSIGL